LAALAAIAFTTASPVSAAVLGSTGFETATSNNCNFSGGGVTVSYTELGRVSSANCTLLPRSPGTFSSGLSGRVLYGYGDYGMEGETYTSIKLANGNPFSSIAFDAASGTIPAGRLIIAFYLAGNEVFLELNRPLVIGTDAPAQRYTYNNVGSLFDEVRMNTINSFNGDALLLDNIVISDGSAAAVPAPSALSMALLAVVLGGASIRARG
jgi:hypothetical protein